MLPLPSTHIAALRSQLSQQPETPRRKEILVQETNLAETDSRAFGGAHQISVAIEHLLHLLLGKAVIALIQALT